MAAIFFLLLTTGALLAEEITPTLINGTPVTPGTWKEVVRITSNGSGCTATIVGPRVILTAAHCASNGAIARFAFGGKTYQATIRRSPIYPRRDHDIAVGVVNEDIVGASPMRVGGKAALRQEITLLGYGCTRSPGRGGNDGVLRIGKSAVVGFSNFDMVSRTPGGAALCFGDSGGPAFLTGDSGTVLLGINSKGNIRDTNYNARLDRQESIDFLKTFSATICGINSECGGDPNPADPSCVLTANPAAARLNEGVSLVLTAQNSVSGEIEGKSVNVPNGELRLATASVGNFRAQATVKNSAGKSASCFADYSVTGVPPQSPSCRLTAVPSVARIGESLSLELQAVGAVDFATIDENPVSVPVGKLNVSRSVKGDYSAKGFVRGPSGSASCFAEYRVEEGKEPPPLAEFSVIATSCGKNRFPESGVASACLGLVKTEGSWNEFRIPNVLLVKNQDESFEALPVLAQQTNAPFPGTVRATEDLFTYGSGFARSPGTPVLAIKKSTLTRDTSSDEAVKLEGWSSRGKLFLIESFSPFNVREHFPAIKVSQGQR
jgi:hypothetical protein